MNEKGNPLAEKSYTFALQIVKASRFLMDEKREYIFSKQLLRCRTSIGANIAEANGAISTADFYSKISIAYKESLETKYWLRLLQDSDYLAENFTKDLLENADELSRIMFSILKSHKNQKRLI